MKICGDKYDFNFCSIIVVMKISTCYTYTLVLIFKRAPNIFLNALGRTSVELR